MDSVYVLNKNFEILGMIDSYTSLIWRPAYSDIGDCELYLSASIKAMDLLQKNRYLVRSSDISADDNGIITYKKVMVIKGCITETDVENGDHLTVTGKELKIILNQRLIWDLVNFEGTAEEAIRQFIDENAINPSNPNRIIPNLSLDDAAGFHDDITKQAAAVPLADTIAEICSTYDYGWDIYIKENTLRVRLYNGIDRSEAQSERKYVVFSDDYNNIDNSEYQMSCEAFANTALVGGEGEGVEKIYTVVNDDNIGLERFETYIDANDVSRTTEDDVTLTMRQYINALEENGREELSKLGTTEGFVGEVTNNVGFVYERDYFLGDIVTVKNKYGVSKNVRVISAIESSDASGTKLTPQFNFKEE